MTQVSDMLSEQNVSQRHLSRQRKERVGQGWVGYHHHDVLARTEPDRILYLAIREAVYNDVFEEPIGTILLENRRVRLIVFDPHAEVIVKWIP